MGAGRSHTLLDVVTYPNYIPFVYDTPLLKTHEKKIEKCYGLMQEKSIAAERLVGGPKERVI